MKLYFQHNIYCIYTNISGMLIKSCTTNVTDLVPVWKNSRTLMFPKQHKNSFIFNYSGQCANHALPYTGQISQTKHIMELCWCGQKMCLWKNKRNTKMRSRSLVSSLYFSSLPSLNSHWYYLHPQYSVHISL